MKINFGGHDFVLHHSGIMVWPQYHMAIVSDLHLEKGSHFAQKGFFLPPYDSAVTLIKLLQFCESHSIKQLLILGDCFHDPKGHARLVEEDQALFAQLVKYDPIWIKGNHDKDFVPPEFTAYEIYERDSVRFIHEATKKGINEISGHFHPKISIVHKGGHIQRACFVTDGKKMILPSYGAYTGGLDISSPVINQHFSAKPDVYALGESRIFHLANH